MTKIQKGRDGWEAKDTVQLGGDRILVISTYKSGRGGIQTSASGHTDKGDGTLCHVFAFDGSGDYSEQVARNQYVRCTEKTITQQHAEVMARVDAIVATVQAHYATQKESNHV